MTILSVVQQMAAVVGIDVPSTVFGATDRELIELQDLANEMAQKIAFDGHDWTLLKTLGTLTGTGAATTFPLPSDYKRMVKKAKVWMSQIPTVPAEHIVDTDQWLGIEVQSFGTLTFRWTLIGSQILVKPAMANAATAKFYYLTNAIVDPVTGPNQTTFSLDTDTFVLDERMLKLAMIWQWRADKGLLYAEDMDNFEEAKAVLAGNDRGSVQLTVGRQRLPSSAKAAYPGILTG